MVDAIVNDLEGGFINNQPRSAKNSTLDVEGTFKDRVRANKRDQVEKASEVSSSAAWLDIPPMQTQQSIPEQDDTSINDKKLAQIVEDGSYRNDNSRD